MSIAHNFRTKWRVIAEAADASRDKELDERYSFMAQATEIAGIAVTTKEVITGYQKALEPQFFALGNASGMAICFGGRWHGWLFKQHPDGHLVSHQKLNAWEGKIMPDTVSALFTSIKK